MYVLFAVIIVVFVQYPKNMIVLAVFVAESELVDA